MVSRIYPYFDRRLQEIKGKNPNYYEQLIMELEMWAGSYEFPNLETAVESQIAFRTGFNNKPPREMVDLIFRNKDSELFMRTLLTL